MHDERAVGKLLEGRFVEAALSRACAQALRVKLIVDRVGTALAGV